MRKRTVTALVPVLGIALWATPVGAASALECRTAWRTALSACLAACGQVDLPAGVSVGRCRAACRNLRVKRAFLRQCRLLGG